MPTTKDIQEFVKSLHPTQMRFIRDLNAEELTYLCDVANNTYEGLFDPVQSSKLRLLNEVKDPSTNREKRVETKMLQLFSFMNELAQKTDKEISKIVESRLWAYQDIYSAESALIQDIITRLERSEGKHIPQLEPDDVAEAG